MSPRVHQVDSDGNLEWVERIIDNTWSARRLRGEKITLTRAELQKLLRQAYRSGACEHEHVIRAAIDDTAKLFPSEKP